MPDLLNTAMRQLCERGMQPCTDKPQRFTLRREPFNFAASLSEDNGTLRFSYGCAFTSKMAGTDELRARIGITEDECALRFAQCISNQSELDECIREAFSRYAEWERIGKDAVLAQAKQLRKEFLQLITDRLKPLGFRKKSNSWKMPFRERFEVEFHAQKSGYSDTYYFRVYIRQISGVQDRSCFYDDVTPGHVGAIDWQLIDPRELQNGLDDAVQRIILPILETDLGELGKQKWIQKKCSCSRQFCADCWVEKNLWELQESNE